MLHTAYKNAEPFDFRGLTIRELTPKGLESSSVAEIEVSPGASHETARSVKSDKIYICTQGVVVFKVGNRDVSLGTGDLLFIPKNEWFRYSNISGETARLILVHIPPFDLECEEFQRE